MDDNYSKRKILFIALSVFSIIVAFLLLFFLSSIKKEVPKEKNIPTPSAYPTTPISSGTGKITVLNVTPKDNSILTPGKTQTFSIEFSQPTSLSDINIYLSKTSTGETSPQSVDFSKDLSSDKKTVNITTTSPLVYFSKYYLSLKDKQNRTIFEASYFVDKPSPTAVTNNNPALKQYLPYQTSSYKLSYDENTNTYIFNFRYNPNSRDDLDTQYNKAKADAISFIQSKGIDINSITIDWKHS